MWVTLLVATASPAAKLTGSRRSRYMSVQAPSRVVAPSARAVRPRVLRGQEVFRDMMLPLDLEDVAAARDENPLARRNVEHVAERRMRSVGNALQAPLHRPGDLGLAEQEEIRIVAGLRRIERRLQHVA